MATGNSLPTLYKGAGPGTHWHRNDARLGGFLLPGALAGGRNATIRHITAYSAPSAYMSFTASFAIARNYGLLGPAGVASSAAPGYVYEIDLSALTAPPTFVDPITLLSSSNGHLVQDHNGGGTLIAEVALGAALSQAHQAGGGMLIPTVQPAFRALIFALRDAEILVSANVPAGAIVRRHDVF